MSADPAWAHETVELRAHDPRWPDIAAAECASLAISLQPWLTAPVEHVGSTAVPGLIAKPVIDLMASVRDPGSAVSACGACLAAAGWHYVPPELDTGHSWRRFFVKPDASRRRRAAHLHVIAAGHPRWAQQLAFRDALRRDSELAERYADLKRTLAARHAGDREAYTRAKAEFVAGALR